jgi:uncharacterized protein YndB with AHSA1/START domain
MMFFPDSFKVSTPTDLTIEIERDFNAPRELVFDAFTKPELVRRWLLGPDGWTMPVCEIDLEVGGRYRYVWRKETTGQQMGMGGVFKEIARPAKLWPPKSSTSLVSRRSQNVTAFEQKADTTTVAARAAARSGMERGMAAGYDRLEGLLSSLPPAASRSSILPMIAETTPQLARPSPPGSAGGSASLGPGLNEIMTAVKSQGIGPAGLDFTIT